MLPRPTAPKWTTDNRPIRMVSTEEIKGIEMLDRILGIASLRISLFIMKRPLTRNGTANGRKITTNYIIKKHHV